MATSTRVITKPRKRAPAAGTLIGVRLQPELLEKVDAFRAKHTPQPSRPEAIRQILIATFKLMGDDEEA